VELLPECEDIDPDEPDALEYNRTALMEATRKGNEGVVKLLSYNGEAASAQRC